jgi:LysM repeat protein
VCSIDSGPRSHFWSWGLKSIRLWPNKSVMENTKQIPNSKSKLESSSKSKTVMKSVAFLGVSLVVVTSGCSLLSAKNDQGELNPKNVSLNSNDVPIPAEINNDIGRLVSNGGSHFDSGRVNVNVNINFNGQGWSKSFNKMAESDSGAPAQGRQPANTEDFSVSVDGMKPAAGPNNAGNEFADASDVKDKSGGDSPLSSHGSNPGSNKVSGGSETKKYKVKNGDTLMKISFESYGDIYRWREILNANRDKIKNYSDLKPGTELTINGVGYVVIEKNGKPYLIVRHDTLGKISNKVYGSNRFWKELWQNNPQLIHNPNKIYAGFTLYYRDKSELGTARVPASKSTK